MRRSTKKVFIYLGIIFGAMIIIANFLKVNSRPDHRDSSEPSSPKLEVVAPVVEPAIEIETLYVLSKANVRSGSGKEHKVIDRLERYQTVEVYKDDSTKWKSLVNLKGFVYHTLLGTEEQYEEAYWKNLNKGIREFKRLGLITEILEPDVFNHKIYVNYNIWTYDLTTELRQKIMTGYAFGMSLLIEDKYLKGSVGCSIHDSSTGQRIISYQLGTNKFF